MEQGGASAVSVLVEKEKFSSSIEILKKVRKMTHLPILAKGFFFNPRQIADISAAGADAFLLMVRVVESQGKNVKDLLNFGVTLGLDAVIEVSNTEELNNAINLGARIIEINNRDIYGDLEIDFENVILGRNISDNIIFISASGIVSAKDISKLYSLSNKRVNAFLIGTSIMKSRNFYVKVQELVKACKEVAK